MAANTIEAYKCPKGVIENDKSRAIAWYLVDLVGESLRYTDALELVKKKEDVIALLSVDM